MAMAKLNNDYMAATIEQHVILFGLQGVMTPVFKRFVAVAVRVFLGLFLLS